MNFYRLIVGAMVLAIVIPAWVFGVPAMWLVAIVCILVVIGAVVAETRVPSIREWLRHRTEDQVQTEVRAFASSESNRS
jgi:hypothetical protein